MTAPFELAVTPALARVDVDRAESLRSDQDRLVRRWPDAVVLALDERGRAPVPAGTGVPSTLQLRPAKDFGDQPPDGAAFLGTDADRDYWAVFDVAVDGTVEHVPGRFGARAETVLADGERWIGLREIGDRLDSAGAGLLTTAVALRNWYRRGAYCACCGGRTTIRELGWASTCVSCGREEYPRTDPAVICLVHDDIGVNGERVLLARGAGWPDWARSVLAGFVEAGESLESCVVREVREEVGLAVDGVRYLGSQPWPFPRSIMLGFAARAPADAVPAPADGEISAAGWYTRADVLAGFARGHTTEEPEPGQLRLPGNASIARVMLESWAGAAP